ncbi:MAG: LacI family DNA-binding transcriptional regulator [Oceanipulchritudo sp.]
MPNPEKPVRLRDIAEAAGLSVQAVSMALRDHKRIAPATRERVREIAERLGYRADPAMAALARYRTGTARITTKWERVALVDDWADERWWESSPVYRRLHAALHAEAQRRGIELTPFRLGWQGRRGRSTFQHIYQLGIRGVLVAPLTPSDTAHTLSLPANRFNFVTFGPEQAFPAQHVVQFDFYENARLAWNVLRGRGHQRIGLIYAPSFGWRTGHAWLGAFLCEKRLAGFAADDLQPLVDNQPTESGFREWVARERPDAVITIVRQVLDWNRQLPSPIPVALLSATEPGDTGINVNPEEAANAAFELLLMEMHQSLTATRHLNLRIHVPGIWVD